MFFTKYLWRIATGGAAIISLVLGFLLLQAQLENRHLTKEVAALDLRINDPKTGYATRLAQSETNVATLKASLDTQNAAIRTLAAEDAQRLATTESRLIDAQRQNKEREQKMREFLALPPRGKDLLSRYEDIDQRLLDTLK